MGIGNNGREVDRGQRVSRGEFRILVRSIPQGYKIKKWGDIGNRERWWSSSSQAYLERKILLRYNKVPEDTWLVYYNTNKYTILERSR